MNKRRRARGAALFCGAPHSTLAAMLSLSGKSPARAEPWACDARLRRVLAIACVVLPLACAAPGADIHLAPLWSRTSTADGARETDALGGLWQHRTDLADGTLLELTVGPLYGITPEPDLEPGEVGYLAHFLVPFGLTSRHGEEGTTLFYPFFVWSREPEADGSTTWKLGALPGLLVASNSAEGTQFGLFPLWGGFEDFATFNRMVFLLWPLFLYTEREERISYHVPWPILGWTYGGGESSFRLFPLYSRTRIEGRFDRTWFLWPFFHYQRNHLGGEGEEPETTWMLWPLYGHTQRGTFTAHTTLWPFFGYSSDPRSGFWALDFPWPFVRLQRGPEGVHRTRFWPFYSYLRANSLESTSFLWPIIQFRHETYVGSQRDSSYVIPFWQAWDRTEFKSGETSAWRKLFPIFQYERFGEASRGSFPTLDPFWRNELIDRHYGWIWKLWEWRRAGEVERDRSWLGLFKRERNALEERRSLAGLWASRRYRSEGKRVKETSLLFGLLRWRVTEDEGFDMLRPALPGPGWPALPARPEPLDETRPVAPPAQVLIP